MFTHKKLLPIGVSHMQSQIETKDINRVLREIASILGEIRANALPSAASDFVDTKEASKVLNVSEAFVRKNVFENKIKHYRIGRCVRFKRNELMNWASND
jgi:excisionase family DNA binding protein